ncbi:enolase C-terminal domain-like protein [Candidatus Latescibacterota bacterium]
MKRRGFLTGATAALAASTVMPAAATAAYDKNLRGLPPLKITDAKVITTSGGRRSRWVILKVMTSEPGLYGIGSANNQYQWEATVAALEKHLIPWLIGKDADRIEDLWATTHYRTYWRNGPINNNVVAALDEALWDIKGKRANMPVYQLLGGKARDGVACYDHVGGRTKEEAAENVQKSMETGYRHIRVQVSGQGGYGGGGFIPSNEGSRVEGGYMGNAFDEEKYLETVPPFFDYIRTKIGFDPKLTHDVHSHLSGVNALQFARLMEPYRLFFIEDLLAPEQIDWYRHMRKISTAPQAVGEVFSHTYEYLPLVTERLIDFVRMRVTAIGGITQAKKIANLCEFFGVKTAWQEGGENDPINQLSSYHVDISSQAFGIQEENGFPAVTHEMMPGIGEIRGGYLYGNDLPGLGIDIDEKLAAKYPIGKARNGAAYGTDRGMDGGVVRP